MGKSLVRENAEKNPDYNPYCMRCSGLHRMKKVMPFFWQHECGAVHDERTDEEFDMSNFTTQDGVTVGTGDRIRAHAESMFIAKDIGTYSIAGVQDKVVGDFVGFIDVTGTVIHVKGNHPTNPTRVWVYMNVESSAFPIAKETCASKHPGVEESVFEYTPRIKIDVIPR